MGQPGYQNIIQQIACGGCCGISVLIITAVPGIVVVRGPAIRRIFSAIGNISCVIRILIKTAYIPVVISDDQLF